MKPVFRLFTRVLPGFALLLLLASASWAEPLRVAVSPDYEPLAFKRDGKLAGIEVDNALAVGTFLGREVEYVEMPLDQFIPALEIGKVDVVMSGFSVTAERQQKVDFATPFMEIGQMVIVRTDDVVKFSNPRSLRREGVRIGIEAGTTGEAYALENFPNAKLQNFENSDDAFAALRAGVTDAYIHDAPTSWLLASSGENQDLFSLYRPLTSEDLAWAVKKGNVVLLGQLNAALEALEENGHLRAIRNAYIPVTVEVR